MLSRIHFGINLGFARYVWSTPTAIDLARDVLGLHSVELVTDNDFGPALFCMSQPEFERHHRDIGRHARRQGVRVSSAFTFYRDSGSIADPNPAIRDAGRKVLSSLAVQAACAGAPFACASLMTANRDDFSREPHECRQRALAAWQSWMFESHQLGLQGLLVEMSAQAREDCATIAETRDVLDALQQHHAAHPGDTAPAGLCYDVGHGISAEEAPDDAERDFRAWFRAFPNAIREVHLKNTDPQFLSVWPFTPAYQQTGVIEPLDVVRAVRDELQGDVDLNLEIAGKRGREIGERQIIDDLKVTIAIWMQALKDAGFVERDAGLWEQIRMVEEHRPFG